jgi:hypothetical protein
MVSLPLKAELHVYSNFPANRDLGRIATCIKRFVRAIHALADGWDRRSIGFARMPGAGAGKSTKVKSLAGLAKGGISAR